MILQVKVKPRSRTSGLEQLPDGTLVTRLRSPPVDGKADAELVTLIAGRLKVIRVDQRK